MLFHRGPQRLLALAPLLFLAAGSFALLRYDTIGKQPDGRYLIPTGQLLSPAGVHVP